jgi:thiol:disulfide interchange protein DsbC
MPFLLDFFSRRIGVALALALGALLTVPVHAGAQAAAPDKPAPLTKEGTQIKKLLEQKFDGVKVGSVVKSSYGGLYEVMFDDQIVYTDPKVSFVLVGNLYDTATKKNMTDAKIRELSRVAFDSLPLDLAIKKVKGNGQRRLAVFSDADCPFCARLETELKSIDNVTIYTFLFPIDQLHPDAARKSRMIWCAPDKVKAWDAFFASGALPQNNGDCDTPLDATRELGQRLKVNATPTMVFADGSVVPGALPAPRLEAEIANGETQAARLAAVKKK